MKRRGFRENERKKKLKRRRLLFSGFDPGLDWIIFKNLP